MTSGSLYLLRGVASKPCVSIPQENTWREYADIRWTAYFQQHTTFREGLPDFGASLTSCSRHACLFAGLALLRNQEPLKLFRSYIKAAFCFFQRCFRILQGAFIS